MPGAQVDDLMQIWAALNQDQPQPQPPPFASSHDLNQKIDQINDTKTWQSFSFSYNGADLGDENLPAWKKTTYQLSVRNAKALIQEQLACPEFKDSIDYCPRQIFGDHKNRIWSDFMSGNWAWEQCVSLFSDLFSHFNLYIIIIKNVLSADVENDGAMFVPVILGSDKTTVSVATGNVEYWPLYLTTGNVHNSARRSHGSAVGLLGFLAIPKSKFSYYLCLFHITFDYIIDIFIPADKEFQNDQEFRDFRRQLFHVSLEAALAPLHSAMTKPEVTLCADGHYRRAIYGIGPYIGDYPEQVLLTCIVQGWCPR